MPEPRREQEQPVCPPFIIVYTCPECGWWTCGPPVDGRCQNRPVHDPPVEVGKRYDPDKFPQLAAHRYEPVAVSVRTSSQPPDGP